MMNRTELPDDEESNIILNFTQENDEFVEFEIFRIEEDESGNNEDQ